MPNAFGTLYTLTTFGESHGVAIGGIVDGMPPGIDIDHDFIQDELDRRKPGQNKITTGRRETDKVELLSGIFEGKSTGAPIGFMVRNENQQSKDYENISMLFRPSHADYTYYKKYGIRDYRGGGRASARITIARVVAGALAKLVLRKYNITIQAYTSQVGNIALDKDYNKYDLSQTELHPIRCPDKEKAKEMEKLILKVKSEGDTIGGIITCVVKGCPIGLGDPEFGKLHAQLGAAMLSINAAKGFDERLGIDGIIMTKMDGDSRGGAALSAKKVTGKPVKFIGMGEKMDALEQFHPERMASRILGMGDLLSLIEQAEAAYDEEQAAKLEKKLRKNQFTLEDFLEQMGQIKKMGGLGKIVGMLPGMSGRGIKEEDIAKGEAEFKQMEAIIQSMTREERKDPKLLNAGRRRRISAGSGQPVNKINNLIKKYEESRKMMKKFSKKGKMPGMFKGL